MSSPQAIYHGEQLGIILGGVVWCGILFRPVIMWLASFFPGTMFGVSFVFGVGGSLGFLACALLGRWLGRRIAGRLSRSSL